MPTLPVLLLLMSFPFGVHGHVHCAIARSWKKSKANKTIPTPEIERDSREIASLIIFTLLSKRRGCIHLVPGLRFPDSRIQCRATFLPDAVAKLIDVQFSDLE